MNKKMSIAVRVTAAAATMLFTSAAIAGALWKPRKEGRHSKGKKIVCIGDSITFGAGVVLTRNRDCWVRILDRMMKPEYTVLNYGICGAALMQESAMPYAADFWQAAKELQAQVYILMLGTNDTRPETWNAEAYAKQLAARVQELMQNPGVQDVCLMAPPPMYKKGETGPQVAADIPENTTLAQIRNSIRACAEKNGLTFIDLYDSMKDHPEYMKDGVHPNKQGNLIIAQTVFNSLQSGYDLETI